jgi:hypothetical protein
MTVKAHRSGAGDVDVDVDVTWDSPAKESDPDARHPAPGHTTMVGATPHADEDMLPVTADPTAEHIRNHDG